jgi:hypothetical protein
VGREVNGVEGLAWRKRLECCGEKRVGVRNESNASVLLSAVLCVADQHLDSSLSQSKMRCEVVKGLSAILLGRKLVLLSGVCGKAGECGDTGARTRECRADGETRLEVGGDVASLPTNSRRRRTANDLRNDDGVAGWIATSGDNERSSLLSARGFGATCCCCC